MRGRPAVCLLQVDCLRLSRDRKKSPAGGPAHYDILLQPGAAYQLQFSRRCRLPPSLSLCLSLAVASPTQDSSRNPNVRAD